MKLNEIITEDLRAWFGKGKKGGAGGGGWDAYNSSGERIGKCGDTDGQAKPKCLSKSAAAKLRNADKDGDGKKDGKAGIARAVKRKRAKDPNPNRRGAAKNVSNESNNVFVNEEPAVGNKGFQRTRVPARIAGWPIPAQSSDLTRVTYVGPNSRTWDENRAREAQEMEDAGATPEEIWRDTQMLRGVDNAWRQEIDDSNARIKVSTPEVSRFDRDTYEVEGRTYRADEILDHPELFDAYPELRDYKITFYDNSDDTGSRGFLLARDKLLGVGAYDKNDEGKLVYTDPQDILSTTMHEIGGHGVQNIEPEFEIGGSRGFLELDILNNIRNTDVDPALTRGDDHNDMIDWVEQILGPGRGDSVEVNQGWDDVYRGYGGEIDARSIQQRLNYDSADRAENMPRFDDNPIIVTRRDAPPENLANNPNVTTYNSFGEPINVVRNPNWNPQNKDGRAWPDPRNPISTPSTPSTPRTTPAPTDDDFPPIRTSTPRTPRPNTPSTPRTTPAPTDDDFPPIRTSTPRTPVKKENIATTAITRLNKIFTEASKKLK